MANPNEDLEPEETDEEGAEDQTLADEAEGLLAAINEEAERVRALTDDSRTADVALGELSDTALSLMGELTELVRDLAQAHDDFELEMTSTPSRSALVASDARVIIGTLYAALEFCKKVKNERAKNQDRVPEALEICTQLRHAYERATELFVMPDEQEASAADQSVTSFLRSLEKPSAAEDTEASAPQES